MKVLVLFFCIIPVISLGQSISSDFEDNELTDWFESASGHWHISGENPINGKFSLHHSFDNDESATDWIALFHEPLKLHEGQTVWEFSIRYDFNPSSNNNWAIVLSENSFPWQNMENALVFGVNFEGNSDELQMWRVYKGTIECILNTGFNWEENTLKGEQLRFRLSISESDVCKIEIDTLATGFFTIGSGKILSPEQVNVFSLYYKYTSTFDMGLAFDDLNIRGNFLEDTFQPVVESISVSDQQTIEIIFSEIVRIINSEFCIENVGCTHSDYPVGRSFLLKFPGTFLPGNRYYLYLPEMEDIYGNKVSTSESTQLFYYPGAYDLIINEILADPAPAVLLPEIEYVELFNRSDEDIFIKDWYLSSFNSKAKLPDETIPSGGYAILYDQESPDLFQTGIHTIKCNSFPKLNNQGAELKLQDKSGRLIHAIEYSSDWFETASKKEGGWSLEMIAPDDPCAKSGNWSESIAYRGGTPGEENSVYQSFSGNSNPELWRAAITDSGSLVLYFSEPLDSLRSISTDYFTIDNGIGEPDSIIPAWPVLDKVELCFQNSFKENLIYEISVTSDLCDCSGYSIRNAGSHQFSVYSDADSADLVINEIMFDPEYGFAEYIELFNHSNKTLDIRNYKLIVGEDNDTFSISEEYFPVKPNDYVVIASQYTGIDSDEQFKKAEKLVCMRNIPVLPNTGAQIYLLNRKEKICDVALYSPEYHHELFSETQGVALERISWKRSGLEPGNWHSASSDAGYQTPAAINSQSDLENPVFHLEIFPETITPNGDGVDDILKIHYRLDGSGYMGRISVFDKSGRKIATLASGDILGTEGEFIYHGKDNDNNDLPSGYYILFFEAYHQNGSTHRVKESFVIARGL